MSSGRFNAASRAPWLRCGLLLATLALAGCASDYHRRETLVLDAPDIDEYRVVYLPFDGCLLKRELPTIFSVQRDQYRLVLQTLQSNAEGSPSIEVEVSGAGSPEARFPGTQPEPVASRSNDYTRYRVLADSLELPVLTVEVYAGERLLGQEQLAVKTVRCRALGFGETKK